METTIGSVAMALMPTGHHASKLHLWFKVIPISASELWLPNLSHLPIKWQPHSW